MGERWIDGRGPADYIFLLLSSIIEVNYWKGDAECQWKPRVTMAGLIGGSGDAVVRVWTVDMAWRNQWGGLASRLEVTITCIGTVLPRHCGRNAWLLAHVSRYLAIQLTGCSVS